MNSRKAGARAEKAHNAMGQAGINCRESGVRKQLRISRQAFALELPTSKAHK